MGTNHTDIAIVGAGVAACSLVATLRRQGWQGSISLLESGRGAGGRAATRRSRHNPNLQINHGAPLFNLEARQHSPLIDSLSAGGWIKPFQGPIHSLDHCGQIGPPIHNGFTQGALWMGQGGMDQLAAGLLALAAQHPGHTQLHGNTLVRHLHWVEKANGDSAWRLLARDGSVLLQSRWLVLSGTLLAHPRCQASFGWDSVPLQQAAAATGDPQLDQAAATLARLDATASSNLLLILPAAIALPWQQQPWRVLLCTPEAQQRWGLRRVSLQEQPGGHWAVVAESSEVFAARYRDVYGSRSSAAQLLGAAPEAKAEAAVIEALERALQAALGLPTAGAERQLMRWGAAFPQPPGLPATLQLCPQSRIGFCGDFVAGPGFGRIEGALTSAEALAEALLQRL